MSAHRYTVMTTSGECLLTDTPYDVIRGVSTHRYTVMHNGGVLVGHVELVDEGRGVLVEEDAEVRCDVLHQDVDVAVSVR